MLSFEEKTEWFKSQLEIKHNNYGDEIKDEIYFHFCCLASCQASTLG